MCPALQIGRRLQVAIEQRAPRIRQYCDELAGLTMRCAGDEGAAFKVAEPAFEGGFRRADESG